VAIEDGLNESLKDNQASLLSQIIALAPALSQSAQDTFGPLINAKTALRDRLIADGTIVSFPAAPVSPVESMCAVDGARVKDQMYAADLLVAIATTAEAISSATKYKNDESVWAYFLRHSSDSDRLVETAMGSQEILLAARAPHQYRIIDGSYQTPIMAVREGLYSRNKEVRDLIAAMILGEWQVGPNLQELFYPTQGTILALPKSDSATRFAEGYAKKYNIVLPPVADRVLASQLLMPGELLYPRSMKELSSATVVEPEGDGKVKEAAFKIRGPIESVAASAAVGRIRTSYFKPHGVGVNMVLRFEYFVPGHLAPNDLDIALKYASILNAETRVPHMTEPFCQYTVDKRAKQISSGTQALRSSLINNLSAEHKEAYASLLANNYRT
jgi:hypothetical protein